MILLLNDELHCPSNVNEHRYNQHTFPPVEMKSYETDFIFTKVQYLQITIYHYNTRSFFLYELCLLFSVYVRLRIVCFCSPQPRTQHGRLNRHQKPLRHVHYWSIWLPGRPRMSSQAWAQMGANCSHESPFDAISASQLAIHLPATRNEIENQHQLAIWHCLSIIN